jgi:hypothetical protein
MDFPSRLAHARAAMKATGLDCESWADDTLDELATAVLAADEHYLDVRQKAMRFLGTLAAVNSALFLIAMLAIGAMWDNVPAILAAIATFGICFLSYASQAMFAARTRVNIALVAASIASGAIGFILLLVW